MTLIRVKTGEYYDRPEFYPYMPESIFNALELAELKRNSPDEEITVEVEEEDFKKMLDDYNSAKNGS